MKGYGILLIIFVFFVSLSAINAHGVDVTDNHMVIANESNGVYAKSLADSNNIDIKVYKFTSAGEVEHIILHAVNNTDKKIVVIAYQDEVKALMDEYPELANRVFIPSDNEKDLVDAMMLASSSDSNNSLSNWDILVPVFVSLIVGVLIGFAGGLFLAKKKLS